MKGFIEVKTDKGTMKVIIWQKNHTKKLKSYRTSTVKREV